MRKIFLLTTILLLTFKSYSQYPTDERTGKITFTKSKPVPNTKKELLYKRAKQFIIHQNFERIENIRCKDKSHIEVQIIDKAITYSDPVDGKYYGNGFMNFEYRGNERFVITFKYRLKAMENSYKYEFTDFEVMEFVTAPKNKGKSKGFAMADGSTGFASSSGFVEFSANDVRKWPLEEFIQKNAWDTKGSDDVFVYNIKRLLGDLKEIMNDDF